MVDINSVASFSYGSAHVISLVDASYHTSTSATHDHISSHHSTSRLLSSILVFESSLEVRNRIHEACADNLLLALLANWFTFLPVSSRSSNYLRLHAIQWLWDLVLSIIVHALCKVIRALHVLLHHCGDWSLIGVQSRKKILNLSIYIHVVLE